MRRTPGVSSWTSWKSACPAAGSLLARGRETMPRLGHIWAGMVTEDSGDAGTDSPIVLIINTAGNKADILHYTFPDTAQEDQERGQANLYEVKNDAFQDAFIPGAVDTDELNPSSIRVGIRGRDQWAPDSFFVWGREERDEGEIVPLCLVINLQFPGAVLGNSLAGVKLSTDAGEGAISFPLPRVEPGGADAQINSLVLLMLTADEDDAGTDDEIQLQITTIDGRLVLDHTITDTPQDDQERAQANMYFVPVRPFSRRNLVSNSIRWSINGNDPWLPASFFLYGLAEPLPSNFAKVVT